MVYREDFKKHDSKASQKKLIAAPTDRLTAIVLDIAFIAPVISLFIAPLQKDMFVFQLLGEVWQTLAIFFYSTLIAVVTLTLYQTLFWRFYGATIGQKIMRLQVVGTEDAPVSFSQFFLRSMVFQIEVLLLGIPSLAVFYHRQRKTWHDRISETKVVSKIRSADVPSRSEVMFFGALQRYATLTVALFIAIFSNMLLSSLSEAPPVDVVDCSVLDSSVKNYRESSSSVSRLEVAMTLYASDTIQEECISSEARQVLWSDSADDRALAYFAMAFVKKDDAAISNKYFDKTCVEDSDSSACKVAQLLEVYDHQRDAWRDVDWKEYPKSDFARVWGIQLANRFGHFEKALTMIEDFPAVPSVAKFLNQQKVFALEGMNQRDDKLVGYLGEFLNTSDRLWLYSKSCSRLLMRSCHKKSSVCDSFEKLLSENKIYETREQISYTLYQLASCKGKLEESENHAISNFVAAVDSLKKGKTKPLWNMATSAVDSPFTIEARFELIPELENQKEIEEIYSLWLSSLDVSPRWGQMGFEIAKKFLQFGEFESAKQVALLTGNWVSHFSVQQKRELQQITVLSSKQQALALFSRLTKGKSSRMPASDK